LLRRAVACSHRPGRVWFANWWARAERLEFRYRRWWYWSLYIIIQTYTHTYTHVHTPRKLTPAYALQRWVQLRVTAVAINRQYCRRHKSLWRTERNVSRIFRDFFCILMSVEWWRGGRWRVVGFCNEWKANGRINDAGRGMMKECVLAWWWGGAMLMSAPFYSLTSRSNYLAYPESSINVFQPPYLPTSQHHAVAHSRVSVRPFEGSKNPFPSADSMLAYIYYILTHNILLVP